jgi:methylmalonyl-CoA/ethylmalonyl-CoA epimerase
MIQYIDHIGIAVRTLDDALPRFQRALKLKCERIESVPEQHVRVAFLALGETRIELIEATSIESPIARFIEKRGEGIHHIALRSTDLEDDLDRAVKGGCAQAGKHSGRGAADSKVAFLHPGGLCGVLVELCEAHQ